MIYADLLPYFRRFRQGEIGKTQIACAICMWQRQGARL
jgi:hypothetical protein